MLNPDTNARKEKLSKEKHFKKEKKKKKDGKKKDEKKGREKKEKKKREKEKKEGPKGGGVVVPPRRAEKLNFRSKKMLREIVSKLRPPKKSDVEPPK